MVMERRGVRSTNPTANGKHVKRRKPMSKRTLTRLTVALYMVCSALAGAIVQLIADTGWPF